MNWFAKNGDKLFALTTLALGLITQNAATVGLSTHTVLLGWLTVGGSFLTAAHVLLFPNSQTVVAAAPASKQNGFVSIRMAAILAGVSSVAALVVGCAALGLAPATTPTDTIAYAYSVEASALTTLSQLASTGAISTSAATKANNALVLVKQTLDSAESVATSSAPVPVAVITAATAQLATIAAYLTCSQQNGATCQL
jgi:hypothetical protein